MNFGQAIASGFRNYASTLKRSSRSEYWYWVLFTSLVGFVMGVVEQLAGPTTGAGAALRLLEAAFNLGTLVPSIAVSTRRLHDTDRSGYWILLVFTIIGIIPLIYWYCQPGKPGVNRFGRNPLEEAPEDVF